MSSVTLPCDREVLSETGQAIEVNALVVKGVSGSTVALASVARRLAKLTTRPTRVMKCEFCVFVQ